MNNQLWSNFYDLAELLLVRTFSSFFCARLGLKLAINTDDDLFPLILILVKLALSSKQRVVVSRAHLVVVYLFVLDAPHAACN